MPPTLLNNCDKILLRAYMIKKINFRLLLFFLIVTISTRVLAETEWVLVADGRETMPMDSVVCLVSSDTTDRMLIVGKHRTITNIAKVWFEEAEQTAVHSVKRQSNANINIICANNTVFVSGLNSATNMQIYTTDGQIVRTQYLTPVDGTIKVHIDNLAPAIYILRIGDYSVKVLKK